MFYASIGSDLSWYDIDAEAATLTKRGSVRLEADVQYAWPHPSGRYLLVPRKAHQPAQWSRNAGEVVREVLVEKFLHLVRRAGSIERRENVEESQEARAEVLVRDGVGQQPVLDLLVDAWRVLLHLVQQRPTDRLRAGLDARFGAR